MYKFLVLAALVACASALGSHGLIGGYGVAPALGYAAAPALGYAAAPALGYAAAAPLAVAHAPAAITSQHSNILRSYGNLGQVSTYSKTVDTPYSSVTKSDVRVSNPGIATVAHAPVAYAAPAYAATYAHAAPVLGARAAIAAPVLGARAAIAAPVAHAGLLGVAYSAAPAVSHLTYTNSYGLNYGW